MAVPSLTDDLDLNDRPVISKLNDVNQWILGIILIISGFIVCFLGGKYAKKLLFIVGFGVGSLVCYLLINNWFPNTDERIHLFVSCGVGIVIAFICLMIYKICIFTTGAIGGVIIAQGIWQFISIHFPNFINLFKNPELINTIFIIVIAILFGLIAFKFFDVILRGLTAFIGSFMVTIGIAYFVQRYIEKNNDVLILSMFDYFDSNISNYNDIYTKCDKWCYIFFGFWLSLFLCGMFYQYNCYKILKCFKNKSKNNNDYQHMPSISDNNSNVIVKEVHIHHYDDKSIQSNIKYKRKKPASYELKEYT